MFTRYARTGIAVLIGFIFWFSPLIEFNAVASPLLQATPTGVARTPTAQNTQFVKPIQDSLPSSTGTPLVTDKYYEVKSGDTLWSIATSVYGNGSLHTLIQQANGLPEKAVLKVGSKILIPSTGAATATLAPSSQATEYIKPTATPSPQSTASSTVVPMTASSELVSSDTGTKAPATTNNSPRQDRSSPGLYFQLSAYLLSMVCFMGSLCCAYLSIDAYQHNQPYVRRRDIGKRIHAGLY